MKMVACSGEPVGIEGVPEEIKILPLGHVHSQKGDFEVDDESVSLIQKQFKRRNLDLVVDYEHQTLKDMQAPAGGWISDIYKGEDALVARVKWTEKAKEYLRNREYRYLSPVVMVRKRDRKAAAIHSVALTNTPAIDGMFALVNSVDINFDDDEEESKMDLKKLAALLGLPKTATEEEVEQALAAAKTAAEAGKKDAGGKEGGTGEGTAGETVPVANSVILSLLGLPEGAKTEDAATAIMELKAGNGNDEIRALREELQRRGAEDMVQTALKAGKITAAQKDWATEYALSDKEGFKAFVDKAPVVVPLGKMELKDAPEKKEPDYDLEILKNCGVTKEEVEKYYRKED
jgi:phage I-like protein